jgi:hypothetical protein
MINDQGLGGFQRRPDVDAAALGAMLRRVLGPGLRVARTPAGVAAQVYRVQAAGRMLYAPVHRGRLAADRKMTTCGGRPVAPRAALNCRGCGVGGVRRPGSE